MLPVLGLFRTYPCQYCIAGLCTRPNCFFSHQKHDIANARRKLKDRRRSNVGPLDESLPLPLSVTNNIKSEESPGDSAELVQDASSTQVSSDVSLTPSSTRPTKVPVPGSFKEDARNESSNVIPKSKSESSSSSAENRHKRVRSENNGSELRNKEAKKTKLDRATTSLDCVLTEHQSPPKPPKNNLKIQRSSDNKKESSTTQSLGSDEVPRNNKLKEDSSLDEHKRRHHHSKQSRSSKKNSKANKTSDVLVRNIDKDFNPPQDTCNTDTDANDLSKGFSYPGNNDDELEDDPDQVAFECLQMFNNYKPSSVKHTKSQELSPVKKDQVPIENPEIVGKRRIARPEAQHHTASNHVPTHKPTKISATAAMLERYEKLKTAQHTTEKPTAVSSDVSGPSGVKKRIAHVANASRLLKPQPGTSSARETSAEAKLPPPTTSTLNALKPLPESFQCPRISIASLKCSKVPVVVRQKVLDQLFQECRKIYLEPQDAADRALAEETQLSTRCSCKGVYICAGMNAVGRLRKEITQGQNGVSGSSKAGKLSHQSVLAGSSGARTSWSIESASRMRWPPPGPLLYIGISRYLLTEEELVNNNYPRLNPIGGGRATTKLLVERLNTFRPNADKSFRTCDRCTKMYFVNDEGLPKIREQCIYHYGRNFNKQIYRGYIERRFTCCDGVTTSEGCCVNDFHVSSNITSDLRGFVTALKGPGEEESMGTDPWDIVAIDCEMIYTTHGNELARATFIGSNLEVLYDEHVKPIHPVLDYNTRFSGITEDILRDTTTTLTDVQAVLLTHLKPNSILVGHSLESDLIALKLVHNSVVDTSVLFPHRLGPPMKRALRNLSTDFLGKIIQVGESGHDSAEDARTALEIVLWKLKEDNKIKDCFTKS